MTEFLGLCGMLAVILLAVAYRTVRHDKTIRGSAVLILVGGAVGTFALATTLSGMFRFTEKGLGLLILGAVLGFCGADFFWQVVKGHSSMTTRKWTPWVTLGFAVAATVLIVNAVPIYHNIRTEVTGHNVTQVVSRVHGNGG